MTGLYIFIALIVIALMGWGIAELKAKAIHFEHSEAEKEEAELLYEVSKILKTCSSTTAQKATTQYSGL